MSLIQTKYYARVPEPYTDVRPCSRCGTEPARYLHLAWLVKWPTLCAECYLVVRAGEKGHRRPR